MVFLAFIGINNPIKKKKKKKKKKKNQDKRKILVKINSING